MNVSSFLYKRKAGQDIVWWGCAMIYFQTRMTQLIYLTRYNSSVSSASERTDCLFLIYPYFFNPNGSVGMGIFYQVDTLDRTGQANSARAVVLGSYYG